MRHHKHRTKRRRVDRTMRKTLNDERKRRKERMLGRYGEGSVSMCGSKDRYETEADARYHAARCMRYNGAAYLRAYHCPLCRGWHLTSSLPRE